MGVTGESEAEVQALPDFERPPLTEVALGVVFEPVEIGAVGLAELSQRWRDEFPNVQEHTALPPLFQPAQPGPGLVVEVGHPPLRLWMLTEAADRLVQVQRDRLVVNWRRISDGEYPRYHALRALLDRKVADLWSFFHERTVPIPLPAAVEATYVNTIDAAGFAEFLAGTPPFPEPRSADGSECLGRLRHPRRYSASAAGGAVQLARPIGRGPLRAPSVGTRAADGMG